MKTIISCLFFTASTFVTSSVSGQTMLTPCLGGAYELATKFEGTWQEYTVQSNKTEKLEGTLITSFELGGCIITQKFISVDKSFTFMSFGYVDAATHMWNETYVLSNGRVATYKWYTEGNYIYNERISGGDPSTKVRLRIVFHNEDLYEVTEERFDSSGKWVSGDKTMTRRIPG